MLSGELGAFVPGLLQKKFFLRAIQLLSLEIAQQGLQSALLTPPKKKKFIPQIRRCC